MNKFLSFIADVLLRFYMEIIAGFWALFIIIPIDSKLYLFFTGEPSYTITTKYWIFFGFYTTFFFVSGATIPVIKTKKITKLLNKLIKTKQITEMQKEKILKALSGMASYQSIISIEGGLNFVLENLFSISVMFAWFGLEGTIANLMSGETLIVPMIFNTLFLALLILQSFLDDYIAQQMRLKYKKNTVFNRMCNAGKTLAIQIVADVGGGGSSDKMGQFLLEQTITEIDKIMKISNKSKS